MESSIAWIMLDTDDCNHNTFLRMQLSAEAWKSLARLCYLHCFKASHTLAPTSPEDLASFLAFAVADPGPVFPWHGGSLPSTRAHPSHSLCSQAQLTKKVSGSLHAFFLEASWSHLKECVSCTFSLLTDIFQPEKCWLKKHFCQRSP